MLWAPRLYQAKSGIEEKSEEGNNGGGNMTDGFILVAEKWLLVLINGKQRRCSRVVFCGLGTCIQA